MGNPYFTTDTAAAQRAAEIEADIVLKGTHGGVDGVYSEDPRINAAAVKFEEISFDEVIARDLRAMDMTAITFCKDNHLPIRVFDLMADGNLGRALDGQPVGTLVK
jgi:uridylate kinase